MPHHIGDWGVGAPEKEQARFENGYVSLRRMHGMSGLGEGKPAAGKMLASAAAPHEIGFNALSRRGMLAGPQLYAGQHHGPFFGACAGA